MANTSPGAVILALPEAKKPTAANFVATDISPAALAAAKRNAQRHAVDNRIHFIECNLLEAFPVGAQQAAAQPGKIPNSAPEPGFHESRLNSPLATRHSPPSFDLIASNPPYIGRREAPTLPPAIREHEPASALFGGEEGYELYADLIA